MRGQTKAVAEAPESLKKAIMHIYIICIITEATFRIRVRCQGGWQRQHFSQESGRILEASDNAGRDP